MAPYAQGGIIAPHGPEVSRAGFDEFEWHDLVLDDLLAVINVVQEKVERLDALLEPGLQNFPFADVNDAGDGVKREDLLGSFLAAVDRKGHAPLKEPELGAFLAPLL